MGRHPRGKVVLHLTQAWAMWAFKDDNQPLKLHSESNREPVQHTQQWGCLGELWGSQNWVHHCILDWLPFPDGLQRQPQVEHVEHAGVGTIMYVQDEFGRGLAGHGCHQLFHHESRRTIKLYV